MVALGCSAGRVAASTLSDMVAEIGKSSKHTRATYLSLCSDIGGLSEHALYTTGNSKVNPLTGTAG